MYINTYRPGIPALEFDVFASKTKQNKTKQNKWKGVANGKQVTPASLRYKKERHKEKKKEPSHQTQTQQVSLNTVVVYCTRANARRPQKAPYLSPRSRPTNYVYIYIYIYIYVYI